MAVRNIILHGALSQPERMREYVAAGLSEQDARLLSEADATDFWTGERNDMLKLLRAEYAKLDGQKLGGHISAVVRRHMAQSFSRGKQQGDD